MKRTSAKQVQTFHLNRKLNNIWFIMRPFTLVELLVVIMIIAILASMLLPALKKVQDSSKRIQCLAQTKGSWTAFNNYADEFKGYLPNLNAAGGVASSPSGTRVNQAYYRNVSYGWVGWGWYYTLPSFVAHHLLQQADYRTIGANAANSKGRKMLFKYWHCPTHPWKENTSPSSGVPGVGYDDVGSYWFNTNIGYNGAPVWNLLNPSKRVMTMETPGGYYGVSSSYGEYASTWQGTALFTRFVYHGQCNNFSFVDGHAASLDKTKIPTLTTKAWFTDQQVKDFWAPNVAR